MKRIKYIILIMLLSCFIMNCDKDKAYDDIKNPSLNDLMLQLLLNGLFNSHFPGQKVILTADGVSFSMVYVPGGTTFPTGETDNGTAIVPNAYWIGETEATYELWKKVYDWATAQSGDKKYYFAHPGAMGGYWTGAAYSSYSSGHNTDPVTMIDWRDCMVWCNALTEWYNAKRGTTYDCVYYTDSGYITPIRSVNSDAINTTPGSQDNPFVKPNAKGFRLLSKNEWELAARWRSDSTNTVAGYSNPWFTKGDSSSGATAIYTNASATSLVAWYLDNSSSSAQPVKGKSANSLGIYDMSGNVWEWCFDWHPNWVGSARALRGGSFREDLVALMLCIGYCHYNPPGDALIGTYGHIGFRFSMTE